ncbi:hypothetical protein ACROYT_G008995 [Oculina patagonica]
MEGSCYHFSSGASLNWTAAKSACEDLGSNLVVINSQAEQQAIAAKVSQRTWIGLYRNPKDKSRWLWVDGSPVTYTNWARGEPNHPNSQKCAEMYPKERGWKWNDKECYAKFPFVCEKRGGNKVKFFVNKSADHCKYVKQSGQDFICDNDEEELMIKKGGS